MKFLIIGDLHGQMPKIYFKEFDAIIAPGDFCSDALRKYMFQSLKEHLQNPYSKVSWYDYLGKNKTKQMIKKSLADGRKILEFLNSFNVPVYAVPGNWDWTKSKTNWNYLNHNRWKELISGLKNIKDVHHKKLEHEFSFIGHGIISGPEFPQKKSSLDFYKDKPKLLQKIKKEYERDLKKLFNLFVKAKNQVIFLSHNVPYNTALDKINNPASPRHGQHFGSVIARKLIEKYRPLVCIGGHMHEHFGSCKIGKTVCINAGFGSKVNVLLEIEGNKIKQIKFHS